MDDEQTGKSSSGLAIVFAVVVLPLLVVGVALVEEIVFGSVYVSSLYRTPIDWLIETVADLF
jgi:hypothetical protein